ncbi:hypothetical protein F4859DRAFT_236261 [Xylaria cf. heliscus]|nr:hypothetical protein F4859DRAFT_236261 [Xylaria cf. heliscus]
MWSSKMSFSDEQTFTLDSRRDRDATTGLLYAKFLRFVDIRVSHVDHLFIHPFAEEMLFEDCCWDLAAEVPKSGQRHSALRVIRFVGTNLKDYGLNEVLCNLPELRTLEYFRPADDIDTCFHEMGSELARNGQNLEHLTLSNEALMPFCTPFGSLHTLTRLKTLDVDLEFLIGFRDNPRNWDDYMDAGFYPEDEGELDYEQIHKWAGDWSLVKLLPQSLERLTLHVECPKISVYFNTYERFGAKFEELLTAKGQFVHLRWIMAPELDKVAERLCTRPGNEWALIGTSKITMQRTLIFDNVRKGSSDSSAAGTATVA